MPVSSLLAPLLPLIPGVEPYYVDERSGIVLYCGDCRELLPLIPAGMVDLVLTDPPYGKSYVTAWRSRSDKLRVPIQNDTDLSVVEHAWPLAMKALATPRHWYSFASPSMLAEASKIFDVQQIIAWDKGDRGTVGDLECGFGEAWEAILYGRNGRRPLNGKRPRTIIRYDWSATMDPVHPTVKPVPLLQKLIAMSTDVGELACDPFAGSGTTLLAAKLEGRAALGIELEEKYCSIAKQRLRQEVLSFPET